MSSQTASVHPLFDPSGLYGRMRGKMRPEGKMRGYIHFLWSRARQRGDGLSLAKWDAIAHALTPGEGPGRAGLELSLESDAEGRRWLRCRGELEPGLGRRHGSGSGRTEGVPCRAFLLEPEAVAALQSLVGERPWLDAFGADAAHDVEVARILASAPELEGVRWPDGRLAFDRVAVPDCFDAMPPREQPLRVVIVHERPLDA